MKLLSTSNPLIIQDFHDDDVDYAILSHTWMSDTEEVNYKDVLSNDAHHKRGWQKVTNARRTAWEHGFQWVWIDTCCIDKTSSAELSEAINSMYKWYGKSSLCMVYLADLASNDKPIDGRLGECRWFTRGWTLQEMLAPSPLQVHFYDSAWKFVSTLDHMAESVSNVTEIDAAVLRSATLRQPMRYSVAKKLSWMARRTTSRSEDMAYCLLGLFDINMPIIYGEGDKAFFRLQEAILRAVPNDHTIFAWDRFHRTQADSFSDRERSQLLAPSPLHFAHLGEMVMTVVFPGYNHRGSAHEVVSGGVRIRLPTYHIGQPEPKKIALLRCQIPKQAHVVFALEFNEHENTIYDVVKFNGYHIAKETPIFEDAVLLFDRNARLVQPAHQSLHTEDVPRHSVDNVIIEVKPTPHNVPWASHMFGVMSHDTDDKRSMRLKYDKRQNKSRCEGEAELISLEPNAGIVKYDRKLLAKIKFAVSIDHGSDEIGDIEAAAKIIRGSDRDQPEFDLLNSPWAQRTTIEYQRGWLLDFVGSYPLARTIRRIDNQKLLLIRMVPATIYGKTHLIIEAQIINSLSVYLARSLVVPLLQQIRTQIIQIGNILFKIAVIVYIINKEFDVLGLWLGLATEKRIVAYGLINYGLVHFYAGPRLVQYRALWPGALACFGDPFISPMLRTLVEVIAMFKVGWRQYARTQYRFLKDRFNYSRDLLSLLDYSVVVLIVGLLYLSQPYFVSIWLAIYYHLLPPSASKVNAEVN